MKNRIISFQTKRPVLHVEKNPEEHREQIAAEFDLDTMRVHNECENNAYLDYMDCMDRNWMSNMFHDKIGIRKRKQVYLIFCDDGVAERLNELSDKLERKDLILRFDGSSYSVCNLNTGELISADHMTLNQVEVFVEDMYKNSLERMQITYDREKIPRIPWVEEFVKKVIVRAGLDTEIVTIMEMNRGCEIIVDVNGKLYQIYLDGQSSYSGNEAIKSVYYSFDKAKGDPGGYMYFTGKVDIPATCA